MLTTTRLAFVLVLLSMVGCESTSPIGSPGPTASEINRCIVQSISDTAIQNAVIGQHTLYPYHFDADAAELNELGGRELDLLTEHYRKHPGTLNIRKADTPDQLYDQRIAFIKDKLAKAGVNVSAMTLADGLPGGDGRPASEVVAISENRNSPSRPLYDSQQGSTSNGGGNSKSNSNTSGLGGAR